MPKRANPTGAVYGNPFWGTFGGGIGILAGVVAVTSAIHWLVVAAWLLLSFSGWIFFNEKTGRVAKTVVTALILAVALKAFDHKFVPKAPADQHTDVDILTPAVVTGDPYFPFLVAQRSNVAVQYINAGAHAANETFLGAGIDVCRNPLSRDEEAIIWQQSSLNRAMSEGGILTPNSRPRYNTFALSTPLTPDQVAGLNSGLLGLCVTARVVWRDNTGSYCRYSFQSFYREPLEQTNGQAFFNWHTQSTNYNREENCEYSESPLSFWRHWFGWLN